MSRVWRYGLIAALGLAGIALFLLAAGTSNTALFARHYNTLLVANFVVAGVVLAAVLALAWRLARRLYQRRFGARLTMRFALAFSAMGMLPGVVIFLVSTTFLHRSIESWFNVRVDAALESGLTLTRTALDSLLDDTARRTRTLAGELAGLPDAALSAQIDAARSINGQADIAVFTADGRVLASSGSSGFSLRAELPPLAQLRSVRQGRPIAQLESESESRDSRDLRVDMSDPNRDPRLRMRVVVQLADPRTLEINPRIRYLQVLQPVPAQLARNAEAVRAGFQDYRELALSREGLRDMYTLTMTLVLLLAVLASMAGAFLLASRMSAPLLALAEGTRAVASGDFRPLPLRRAGDELSLLMESFNRMTEQLSEARATTDASRRLLEANNLFLENVLANLSAGVLVLDAQGRLSTYNQSAVRILGASLADHRGHVVQQALPPGFAQLLERENTRGEAIWQAELEMSRAPADAAEDAASLNLLVRSAPLAGALGADPAAPEGASAGRVVVFDDITELIVAQRSTAWAEVARRLAHEIKNPLTPIQLSAERLQHRLADKLDPASAEMLIKSCATIINQVTALKRLVNEFRDYARMPAAELAPLDLNALVEDVMRLYEHELGPQGRIAVTLDDRLPLIEGDAPQLRQVIHNLLKNALEACERSPESADAPVRRHIWVSTTLLTDAESPSRKRVKFSIRDSGPGFPAKILARAFEPYVTSKAGGTGLGLAIVKRIADEHGARVSVRNRDSGGAEVEITFTRLVSREYALQAAQTAGST